MLEEYFSAPKTLRRLRTGPSGSYIDGFADTLKRAGYSKASAIRYLRNAAHLGQFTKRVGGGLGTIDVNTLKTFCRHLSRCRCPLSNGGPPGTGLTALENNRNGTSRLVGGPRKGRDT
jgi:hypothetical protein